MNSAKGIRHAVRIITLQEDQILCVTYQSNGPIGFTDFPGGKIEPGETPLDTCARELREETSLACTAFRHLGHVTNIIPSQTFDFQIFLGLSPSGTLHNSAGNLAHWLPLDTLRQSPQRLPITHLIDPDLVRLITNNSFHPFDLTLRSDDHDHLLSYTFNPAP